MPGVFGGQLVVSMRPYLESDIPKVQAITAKYPGAHGAPVHWGDPAEIGIADIVRTQRFPRPPLRPRLAPPPS